MGISLAGAKFHVSEIIGKLGVEGREEAAAWREQQTASRRWSFAPLGALKGWWAQGTVTLTPKAVAAVLIPLAALGIGAGLFVATNEGGSPGGSTGGVAPTVDPCGGNPRCIQMPAAHHFATLEEAVDIASFEPSLPGWIPDDYTRQTVMHWRWPAHGSQAADPQAVHNDSITVVYRDAEATPSTSRRAFRPRIRCSPANRSPARAGSATTGRSNWRTGRPSGATAFRWAACSIRIRHPRLRSRSTSDGSARLGHRSTGLVLLR